MNWNLLVSKNALEELARLPDRDQQRTEAVWDEMGCSHQVGAGVSAASAFYDLDIENRRIVVIAVKRRAPTTY